MVLKDNVKFILQKRGMTQEDLAKKMGVSKQSIHHYLNGNITLDVIQKIAVALDTTVETVCSETPLHIKDTLIPSRGITTATSLVCPHCGKDIDIIAK